jgi:hypothetical protein
LNLERLLQQGDALKKAAGVTYLLMGFSTNATAPKKPKKTKISRTTV